MSFSRPTLKDVAKLSGVSEISVSRVMRNAPNISLRLREKVEAAARELHYTPNKVAGALASNTTDLIGVVLPTLKCIEYVNILTGIESVLAQSKYRMMLGVSDCSSKQEDKIIRDLLSWSPSGMIIVGGDRSADSIQLLERSVSPVIQVLNSESDVLGFGLGFAFQEALDELLSHWKQHGYKKIAYVESSDEPLRAKQFKKVFESRLAKINASLVHQIKTEKPSSVASGVKCCKEVLQQNPDIDVIFLAGSRFADDIAFYDAAEVPQNAALASFGNESSVGEVGAGFDLISFPYRKTGEDSAKLLLKYSQDNEFKQEEKVSIAAEYYSQSPS